MYEDKGQIVLCRCVVRFYLFYRQEENLQLLCQSVCLQTVFLSYAKKKKGEARSDVWSVLLVCLRRPQRDAIHVTFNASLLQGKSVSLTNFFRIARNTMTMCFNKEPGAAEVEVSPHGSDATGLKCSCAGRWLLLICHKNEYITHTHTHETRVLLHALFFRRLFLFPAARVLADRGAEGLPRGGALWEGGHQYTRQWFPHRKVGALFKVSGS